MAALPEGLLRADGMTGVIIFAVVYAIVSILAKAKQAAQKQQQEQNQQPRLEQRQVKQQRQRQERKPRELRPSRPAAPGRQGTQAEGARLEDLLRVLTEAAGVPTPEGPTGRRSPVPLESAEEVEERESLEREEQVLNLEVEERRPARIEVDFDDEAEAVVQRRIRAAEARDRALNREDHQKFDREIRVVPDNTRVARPNRPSIRQAIIWREILGPPLGLRQQDDRLP